MKQLLRISILFFSLYGISIANDVMVFDFTKSELSGLEVRKIRGADNITEYTLGSNENGKNRSNSTLK